MELEHQEDSFDESGFSISRIHNESPVDSMTEAQKNKVGRFYELLANAMPLEGRDYRVEFEPSDDGVTVLSRVVGLNDLGSAFSRQVADYWRRFGIH